MAFKRQKIPNNAKCLVQHGTLYYVAVKKDKSLSAAGGKAESCDRTTWDCLLRDIREETGVTNVILINGPVYQCGVSYYHVLAHRMPQFGDVTIVPLTLKELGDAKKDYTLDRVDSLFTTRFHGYEIDVISYDELV